jgi:glycosidase
MALFQATYIGAPMIWYGDEAGMYGADDPMCRMPMWWEDLGPYENKDYAIREDVRQTFRRLFALRRAHPVLAEGDFLTLLTDDVGDCYAYLRAGAPGEEALLVALNNSAAAQTVRIAAPAADDFAPGLAQARPLEPADAEFNHDAGVLTIVLPPVSGAIFVIAGGEPKP